MAVGYFETARVIAAWCELREDFRHFRTDHIVEARFLEARHPCRPASLRAAWRKRFEDLRLRQAKAAPLKDWVRG